MDTNKIFTNMDEVHRQEAINEPMPPTCHFTHMTHEFVGDGDDAGEVYWCEHCGHTKVKQ